MSLLSIEAIAYEETGHAVAATFLQVPYIALVITAFRGRVFKIGKRKWEDRYFMVSLAGPIARVRFDPTTAGHPDDTAEVKKLLVKEHYDRLDAEMKRLVEEKWWGIKRVAEAALTKYEQCKKPIKIGRLSASEIGTLLESW